MANVAGLPGPVPLREIVGVMTPKGYPIGKPVPLDPSKSEKNIVLGNEVPISNLKVGKQYDIVFADDLSTLHKEIYRKSTGTVKSIETSDDGTTKVIMNIPPLEPGVVFHEDGGLFFKKPGVQYGGRRTRKQKKSRRHRTLRYR